jgi:hypothetical protein
MHGRRVAVDDLLVGHAQALFPLSGTSDEGNPTYSMFEAGPLQAAKEFFSRRFDSAPEAAPGVKTWLTIDLPLFPPMAFYALLVVDDATGEHIRLIDVTVEDPQDYWTMIQTDPLDEADS